MELTKTTFLLVHAYRFVAFTVCSRHGLTPALPSQTAKELIGDACYNELQQREKENIVVLCGGASQQRPCIS